MRKTSFLLCVLALLSCSLSFGEGPVIILQNQEASDFWFTVDPGDLSGLTTGSPLLPTRVAEFFARQSEDPSFTVLAPDATTRLEGLPDGTHLLVGFFAVESLDAFPVRVVSLQADGKMGERFYAVLGIPALMSVPRGAGRLIRFAKEPAAPAVETPAEIAEAPEVSPAEASPAVETPAEITEAPEVSPAAASPAEETPAEITEAPEVSPAAASPAVETPEVAAPIAVFSTAFDPVVFTREKRGEFAVLPIGDSLSWNQTGLRITELNGSVSKGTLRISFTVPSGFSEDVSYFLYIFPSRLAGKENLFTLELRLPSVGKRGACILWQKEAAPALLGTVIAAGSTCKLSIGLDQVPVELLSAAGDSPTFDLTACWFDRASETYEEFYYTTFSMADMGIKR